jgi:hypothetical protein
MEVEGLGGARDVKLWPGGGRAWDWAETGTDHVPGIQAADVEELIERGSETVVLTRGRERRLEVVPETLSLLRARGIVVHVEVTPEAVELYNELAARGERVGGLFHSTC